MSKVTMRAYGRVNLIGEHTDYNGGWVLPTSIPQYTEITFDRSDDELVVLHSSGDRTYSYRLGEESPSDSWSDYLQGGTKLLNEKLTEKGQKPIQGFKATITSTIPEGSGLSSSAALEMSFLKGLNELFGLGLEITELALLGQRIENEFVGAKVGIMDQMATSLAQRGEALFLDTLTLSYERIPLPMDIMDLMVINSGISHRLSAQDGGYNERRRQCEKAAELLGVKYLRDISSNELFERHLPQDLLKRARHVVTENERVHKAVQAIKEKDIQQLGKLFLESHLSMRDDYEVSIPEIDLLVNLCLDHKEVHGARLTGGGFGGSVVALVEKGKKEEVSKKIIEHYSAQTGEKAVLLA